MKHILRRVFVLTAIVALPIAINFLLLQNANATLYFTDHFAYTDLANLGTTSGGGGANWTLASGNVSQIKVTTASTQTSPSGYAPAAGLGVAVTPTGTRKQTGVPFNGATGIPVADGNVVYASFLLNVQTLPSANMRIASPACTDFLTPSSTALFPCSVERTAVLVAFCTSLRILRTCRVACFDCSARFLIS